MTQPDPVRRGRRRWLACLAVVVAVISVLAVFSVAAAGIHWRSPTEPIVRSAATSPDRPSRFATAPSKSEPHAPAIHVAGNQLLDGQGRPVRLTGFNLSGAEYACIEGDGLFDTPDGAIPDERMIAAMATWQGANAVRLPLNEQCWLGIGGAPAQYAGLPYRNAVATVVSHLSSRGFVTILDLHRSAPAGAASREQEPMPDRDHSPAFWASVARTFAADPWVAFDLFNEPFPFSDEDSSRAWTCWRDGGCQLTSTNSGKPFVAAGMTELLTAVRSSGATNVVFLAGVHWAEGLEHWLQYRPTDPAGQLGASVHIYSFNECSTVACYDRQLAPVLATVPLFAGEIGPDLTSSAPNLDSRCPASDVGRSGFSTATIDWLDRHRSSWAAWSWTPLNDCWSLTSDWSGNPTGIWGRLVRRALARKS